VSPASRSYDVIVIGAGCAGLAAASSLAERGARVLVLEARPALGGRATAFTDPATGERVDNGQHVLLGCYRDTFRFLSRIGAADRVQLQDRLTLDIVDRDGHPSRLACPALPPPLNLLAGLMTWDALAWRDRLAAVRVGRTFIALDGETVRDWLIRHHQTSRLIEVLWQPLAVAALNESIDVAAAVPFANVLTEMLGGHASDAAIAVPLRPLDEMYALPARSYIESRGGEVRISAPARVVCGGDGATPRVMVRDEMVSAPTVICAVPWWALAETFVGAPPAFMPTLEAATRTGSSSIVTVNLWFDRVVTDHVLLGLPGRTMHWIFDKRRAFGERASHLSLVSSGADAVVSQTNDQLVQIATREVLEAIPPARNAILQRAVVVRERRATFSVAPGQPPRPSTHTPIRGVLLAGDWIDTGLPATIESAVRSGHMAAAAA